VKSGITLLQNNANEDVKTQVKPPNNDIYSNNTGQEDTNGNNTKPDILNSITVKIIDPLVKDALRNNPSIANVIGDEKHIADKLKNVVDVLLDLPNDDFENIKIFEDLQVNADHTKSQNEVDNPAVKEIDPPVKDLRKPRQVIQVKISGTLTISTGDQYSIRHIIWLELSEPNESISIPTYKVYQITKEHPTDVTKTSTKSKTSTAEPKTFYVQGKFGVPQHGDVNKQNASPFMVLWETELPIELDKIPKGDEGKQSKQKPRLDIPFFHIYIDNNSKPIRDPSFVIHLNSFTLHNNLDKNVLCDFASNITVTPKSQSNTSIKQTHTTFEYDVVVDEPKVSKTASPVKSSSSVPETNRHPGSKKKVGKGRTEKKGVKVGGRRTRRFR
jgi:hypothetical protein